MKGADFVMTLDEVVQREQAAGVLLGPFHRDWLIRNRAPATVREHLRLGRERHWLQMARQGFASMDTNDANTAAFSARNTFTTEVCIIGDTINSAPDLRPRAIFHPCGTCELGLIAHRGWGNHLGGDSPIFGSR